jgi:hypothetical protein
MLATGLLCCECPVSCVEGLFWQAVWGRQTLVAGPLGSVLPILMGGEVTLCPWPRAYLLRRSACLMCLVFVVR